MKITTNNMLSGIANGNALGNVGKLNLFTWVLGGLASVAAVRMLWSRCGKSNKGKGCDFKPKHGPKHGPKPKHSQQSGGKPIMLVLFYGNDSR
ncbi:hypothetical protein [Pasteuria penetrans]|uniref:hypothetical protein n=1 Tax=Pasteuria penetrans TaxID=86005 RepID=UPI000FB611B2|nr:hypothetical protein [Pasteuria penetrans]